MGELPLVMFRNSVLPFVIGFQLVLCCASARAADQPNWDLIKDKVQRIEIIYKSDTVMPNLATTPEQLERVWEVSATFRAPFRTPLLRIVHGMATSSYDSPGRLFEAVWGVRLFDDDGATLVHLYLDRWGTRGRLNGANVEIKDSRILEALRESLCYFPT